MYYNETNNLYKRQTSCDIKLDYAMHASHKLLPANCSLPVIKHYTWILMGGCHVPQAGM